MLSDKEGSGLLKFGWFAKLNASKRSSKCIRSLTVNSRLSAASRFTALGPSKESFPAFPKVPIGLGTYPDGVSQSSVLRLRTYGLPTKFGRSFPILVKELSTPVNGLNQVPERAVRIGASVQVPTNLSAKEFLR